MQSLCVITAHKRHQRQRYLVLRDPLRQIYCHSCRLDELYLRELQVRKRIQSEQNINIITLPDFVANRQLMAQLTKEFSLYNRLLSARILILK